MRVLKNKDKVISGLICLMFSVIIFGVFITGNVNHYVHASSNVWLIVTAVVFVVFL